MEFDIIKINTVNDDSISYTNNVPDIKLGRSRFWGNIIDIPVTLEYPVGLDLAAQLNLNDLTNLIDNSLLPNTGMLYFFIDEYLESGKVIYIEDNNIELKRLVYKEEIPKGYYFGDLVTDFEIEKESLESRYTMDNGIKEWDSFHGDDIIKIGGIQVHCQKDETEILDILKSNQYLLLSIGTGDGSLSVFIDKDDLKNKRFHNCKFEWGQS